MRTIPLFKSMSIVPHIKYCSHIIINIQYILLSEHRYHEQNYIMFLQNYKDYQCLQTRLLLSMLQTKPIKTLSNRICELINENATSSTHDP